MCVYDDSYRNLRWMTMIMISMTMLTTRADDVSPSHDVTLLYSSYCSSDARACLSSDDLPNKEDTRKLYMCYANACNVAY